VGSSSGKRRHGDTRGGGELGARRWRTRRLGRGVAGKLGRRRCAVEIARRVYTRKRMLGGLAMQGDGAIKRLRMESCRSDLVNGSMGDKPQR